jgi:hypothetical protein
MISIASLPPSLRPIIHTPLLPPLPTGAESVHQARPQENEISIRSDVTVLHSACLREWSYEKQPKYSPEVIERAVRMVSEASSAYESQWAAITSIAAKIGCTSETLRRWVTSTGA